MTEVTGLRSQTVSLRYSHALLSRGMTRRSPRGALLTPGTGYRRAEPEETCQTVRSFTGCETLPHPLRGLSGKAGVSGHLRLCTGIRRHAADADEEI